LHKPVVIHVREIPGPTVLRVFRLILRRSSATIVYNSEATRSCFSLGKNAEFVVYNGFRVVPLVDAPLPARRPLRLLLIGRINSWKGQDLLVEAVAGLNSEEKRNIEVKIVGDTFTGQEHFAEKVRAAIEQHGLSRHFMFEGFADDPSPFYTWADVVVIPSRRPEPFGRVAIEGMAFCRPVIGARHGGLSEIVVDQKTGWLFEPNDAASLCAVLRTLLLDPSTVRTAGRLARERFEVLFTLDTMQARLRDVFQYAIGRE
jgi:glycosyltransferase involved in cell wall biosynthesis